MLHSNSPWHTSAKRKAIHLLTIMSRCATLPMALLDELHVGTEDIAGLELADEARVGREHLVVGLDFDDPPAGGGHHNKMADIIDFVLFLDFRRAERKVGARDPGVTFPGVKPDLLLRVRWSTTWALSSPIAPMRYSATFIGDS